MVIKVLETFKFFQNDDLLQKMHPLQTAGSDVGTIEMFTMIEFSSNPSF
jgi:hypothetical protein